MPDREGTATGISRTGRLLDAFLAAAVKTGCIGECTAMQCESNDALNALGEAIESLEAERERLRKLETLMGILRNTNRGRRCPIQSQASGETIPVARKELEEMRSLLESTGNRGEVDASVAATMIYKSVRRWLSTAPTEKK